MRKFCCEKLTKAEAKDGRVVITFERIYVDASLECALDLVSQCATAATKIVKNREKSIKKA